MIAARRLVGAGGRDGCRGRRRLAGVHRLSKDGFVLVGNLGSESARGIVEGGFTHVHGLNHGGTVLDEADHGVGKVEWLAAAFLGVAFGNGGLSRLGNGPVHGHQAVAGILNVRRHGIARDDFLVGCGGLVLVDGAHALFDGAG